MTFVLILTLAGVSGYPLPPVVIDGFPSAEECQHFASTVKWKYRKEYQCLPK
jgi:hypothetical protein